MINTNYLFESLFKGIEKGKIDFWNLQNGQIIKGQVMELLEGRQAFVSLAGKKVLAKLETPLNKGQQSLFQVISTDDEIKLKVLADMVDAKQGNQTSKELLRSLDLKNTANNRLLLAELIDKGLPVEKTVVERLANMLDTGIDQNKLFTAVKLLSGKRLPLTTLNITIANQFLQGEGLLNKLDDLTQIINRHLTSANSSNEQPSSLLPKELQKQLIEIKALNQGLTKSILEFKQESQNSPAEVNKQIASSTAKLDNITGKELLPRLLKYINEIQQLKIDDGLNENVVGLKKSLEELFIKRDFFPKDIATGIERAIQHLGGQALLSTQTDQIFSQTIIQLPGLSLEDNPVYLQINNKKNNGKDIDPEDIRFVFLFQLDSLGDTIVKLHALERRLVIQIYNDNPLMKELIARLEPDFMNIIKAQGFKSSGIAVHSLENNQADLADTSLPKYKGVDIRV